MLISESVTGKKIRKEMVDFGAHNKVVVNFTAEVFNHLATNKKLRRIPPPPHIRNGPSHHLVEIGLSYATTHRYE